MTQSESTANPTDEAVHFGPPAYLAPGTAERQHPSGARIYPALTYSAPDGYRPLHMDMYVPLAREGAAPCVVWIHGGAWLFGSRQTLPDHWPEGVTFQAAIDAGLAVASIDYRHSREAPFPAQLHDVKAAVRYLRLFAAAFGIDPDRIGAWGESAGGHLAALLGLVRDPDLEGTEGVTAGSSEVSAVVDFYGVADVDTMGSLLDRLPAELAAAVRASGADDPEEPTDVILRGSPLPTHSARRTLSPVTHAREGGPPFLLVHGSDDWVVPFSQSEELRAALIEAGNEAELVRVAGAGHVFEGADPIPPITRAVEFLRIELARKKDTQ